MDEFGQVAEDLRSQVLGQLSERISYDKLYQDALRDPTLRRTRHELEVAIDNARTARDLVLELFRTWKAFVSTITSSSMTAEQNGTLAPVCPRRRGRAWREGRVRGEALYVVSLGGESTLQVSTNRKNANEREDLTLLGWEHPLVLRLMAGHTGLGASSRALSGCLPGTEDYRGCLTIWRVEVQGGKGRFQRRVLMIGLDEAGERSRRLEQVGTRLRELQSAPTSMFDRQKRTRLVRHDLPAMIQRELTHAGSLAEGASFSARLLAWVELPAGRSH